MKDLVEKLYSMAGSDWDGDFLALDDEAKDFATKEYLTGEGSGLLEEIFPECCFGAEKLLLSLMYDRPYTFGLVVSALLKAEPTDVTAALSSEATTPDDQAKLAAFVYSSDAKQFAETFTHLVYRYVEDILRDGCTAWFNEIHAEYCEDQYSYSEE